MSSKDKNILFYCFTILAFISVFTIRKASGYSSLIEPPKLEQAEAIFQKDFNLYFRKFYGRYADYPDRAKSAEKIKIFIDSICYGIHHPDSLPDRSLNDLINRTKSFISQLPDSTGMHKHEVERILSDVEKKEARIAVIHPTPKAKNLKQYLRCMYWYDVAFGICEYLTNYSCYGGEFPKVFYTSESPAIMLGDTLRTQITLGSLSYDNIYDIKTTINDQYYPSPDGIIEWTAPPQKPGKYYYTVHTTAKVWDTDSIIENKSRFYYLVR